MKVTIAFDPLDQAERRAAYGITLYTQMFLDRLPGKTRTKESDAHPPLRHVYISTRPARSDKVE